MGYSLELFINPAGIDKEFMCSICQEVLKSPTMIQGCEHIFCTKCIQDWTANSATCPIDRQPIDGFRAPIRAYMNLYNQLTLKCAFGGCSMICNLDNIESHLSLCTYNPETIAACVHDCGALLKMKDRPAHSCVKYLKDKLRRKEFHRALDARTHLNNEEKAYQLHQQVVVLRFRLNSKDAEIKQLVDKNEAESKTLKEVIKAKEEEIQNLQRQGQDKAKAAEVNLIIGPHPYHLRSAKRFKFGKPPCDDGAHTFGHKTNEGNDDGSTSSQSHDVRVTNNNTCKCRLCKK